MKAHVDGLMSCVEILILMLMLMDDVEQCRGLISNINVEVIVDGR